MNNKHLAWSCVWISVGARLFFSFVLSLFTTNKNVFFYLFLFKLESIHWPVLLFILVDLWPELACWLGERKRYIVMIVKRNQFTKRHKKPSSEYKTRICFNNWEHQPVKFLAKWLFDAQAI